MNLEEIVVSTRRKATTESGRNLARELASDRSRIVYSPAFRRLAQKAQVFSLESNAAVRNRISHSIEVSNVGRLIAYEMTQELIDSEVIEHTLQLPIIYAVECACLAHDIGNPPFGHFGESAIKNWFNENWETVFRASQTTTPSSRMRSLAQDFLEFDGNPQGLRILLRLKRDRDEYGCNLTYTTILSFIKYVRSPSELKGSGLTKKAGYFECERHIIDQIKGSIGIPVRSRYILAYIMEAADDIAYCISDIEDGIEKGVIREDEFFRDLRIEWEKEAGSGVDFPFGRIPVGDFCNESDFFFFKIKYTQEAIKSAAKLAVENLDDLLKGEKASLFKKDSLESKAFDSLKTVARKKLFRSPESENMELAGNQIVRGLLERFRPLLNCSTENFERIVKSEDDPKILNGMNLDVEWRLFNRLPDKHVLVYLDQLEEFSNRSEWPEWYFRTHLVVDYISGMTDRYALEQFQLLSGIRLVQNK